MITHSIEKSGMCIKKEKKEKGKRKKSSKETWAVTMTREFLVPIPSQKKRETQISETRQQVKKKNLVARRIKRKEEQIEANLNEDQRRVASQQQRML